MSFLESILILNSNESLIQLIINEDTTTLQEDKIFIDNAALYYLSFDWSLIMVNKKPG